tara:strand:- start:17305 stop:17496 length:192 start_codon:yes stop_codon:yes gene_type:complete
MMRKNIFLIVLQLWHKSSIYLLNLKTGIVGLFLIVSELQRCIVDEKPCNKIKNNIFPTSFVTS